jgi:hypothetical protein
MFTAVFLMAGCNSSPGPAGENTNEGNLSETALPKGKYILEDNNTVRNSSPDTKSFNDFKGNNSNPKSTTANNLISSAENLKRRFKNLLIFHADDTMKINKSYLATLILGKDQVLGDLKNELLESSKADDDEIKSDTTLDIGTKMRAKLIDMSGSESKGFNIELIGGEDAATQSITAKRKKIIWQWKLTPQTPGQQELKLSINVIEKDGETVNLPARNIPVMIFAEKASFGSKVMNFLDENFKWLITAILIPIIIAWITARMRRRNNPSQASKPSQTNDDY